MQKKFPRIGRELEQRPGRDAQPAQSIQYRPHRLPSPQQKPGRETGTADACAPLPAGGRILRHDKHHLFPSHQAQRTHAMKIFLQHSASETYPVTSSQSGLRCSDSIWPEPPISAGKSLNLGRPSRIGSTVCA